jgi:hypothetical protein
MASVRIVLSVYEPKCKKVTLLGRREIRNGGLHNFYSSPNTAMIYPSRRTRLAGRIRAAYKILVLKKL